jgi:Ca-activated chloride channel family protein
MAAPSVAIPTNLTTEPRPERRWGIYGAALFLSLALTLVAEAQFRSGVNVVEVYATVTDARGMPVGNLAKEDFVVREDGEVQQISTFAAGEFPLSAAVALDRSFSMAGERLATATSAARSFLGGLREDDESMLIAIGSRTEVLVPLSRDRAPQYSALASLDAFGSTALYDAIIASIAAVQPARGRRALVLLSDGSDRYSEASSTDALERARASDVLIYPIAIGRDRPAVFAELATLTGGRSVHLKDTRRLPETLRSIVLELRSQYLIGYTPEVPLTPGSREWRSISVSVEKRGLTVRARDGYQVN